MAVTRSWSTPGTAPVMVRVARRGTALRFAWLGAASLLVATGLYFVYQAKVQRMSGGPVVNVNAVTSPEQLLPILEFFPNRAELAPSIFDYLERSRPLRNAGALTAVIPRRQFARVKPLIAVRSARTNEGPATPLGGVMLWDCLNAATLEAVCGPKLPSTDVGNPAIVR